MWTRPYAVQGYITLAALKICLDHSHANVNGSNRCGRLIKPVPDGDIPMVQILNPAATRGNAAAPDIAAIDTLRGKVIGFLDNCKSNFRPLADDLADILQRDFGVTTIIRRGKSNPCEPAPDAVIEELAASCDLVITGTGD